MSDDLTCEWNQHSEDAQHQGVERCTDCLVAGYPQGLAEMCLYPNATEQPHCDTCTCHDDGPRHDEGFVSCDEHLGALKTRYKIGVT